MVLDISKGINPEVLVKGFTAEKIAEQLKHWAHAYYNSAEPAVSDRIYDIFENKLRELDPQNAFLKSIGSPPVGGKVRLPFFMPSLDKVKAEKEIRAFFERNSMEARKKLTNKAHLKVSNFDDSYVVSEKLDGVSVALVEKSGAWGMYTRGESKIGQDISDLAVLVRNLRKPTAQMKGVQIRGELVIKRGTFAEKFSGGFANARNLVSGAVNSKKKDPIVCSEIDFLAYELVDPVAVPLSQFQWLENMGFETPFWLLAPREDIQDPGDLSEILARRRETSAYEVDGLVVTANFFYSRVQSGNPKYSVAFKSEALNEKGIAVVERVEWGVSKNSLLKPVVVFTEPVRLEGASITKATGINAKFIKENGIGPGAILEVIRSGGVIPKITRVLEPAEPMMPGKEFGEISWSETNTELRLQEASEEQAAGQDIKNLDFFFKLLGVDSLGPGILSKIYESGAKTFEDIIGLQPGDLMAIPGFQKTLAEKVTGNIKKSVESGIELWKVLSGFRVLGDNYSEKKIQAILEANPGIRGITERSQLRRTTGISEKSMDIAFGKLREFFTETEPRLSGKIRIIWPEENGKNMAVTGKLTGKQFVFTKVRDLDLEAKIIAHGGEISTGVSKKTTALITKDPSLESSKTTKARKFGTRIVGIDEFRKEIDNL
jgi:NAD-dependent DNA ligase